MDTKCNCPVTESFECCFQSYLSSKVKKESQERKRGYAEVSVRNNIKADHE